MLVAAFHDSAEPTLVQVHKLRMQNRRLKTARELLPPPLMSGDLAV